jgi:hypothetical protein
VSDADRDALLDLLGAVETVGLRGSRDLAAIDAARQRVRRHLDRTSTEPGDRDTDAARSILRRLGLHANSGATLWVAEVIARLPRRGRVAGRNRTHGTGAVAAVRRLEPVGRGRRLPRRGRLVIAARLTVDEPVSLGQDDDA